MDFTLSETQQDVRRLAEQVFAGETSPERLRAVEASTQALDRDLWAALARAGLLGACLPEEVGGAGLGLVEACLILEEQGRVVAPVPLWPTLVAAMGIAEHAPASLRRSLLAAVVAGDAVLTVALSEPGAGDPRQPVTRADADGRLWGTKLSVPAAHVAAHALVTATGPDGPGLFVVALDAPGLSVEPALTTDRSVVGHLTFAGSPAERIGGSESVDWVADRAVVALCALQVGVCAEAVRRAAEYTSSRRQFGRPLSSFQGVALRAADAYIDTEAVRVTTLQAAWRLAEGLDASSAVCVAKWWAAEAGHRVVHAAQHLHGGVGADVDHPIHRYFLWGKQLGTTLGGGSAHLARLGRLLVEASA